MAHTRTDGAADTGTLDAVASGRADGGSLRASVAAALAAAVARAVADGALPQVDETPVEVMRPANPAHGDFATNIALKLARSARRPPMAIAATIADAIRGVTGPSPIDTVDVAPPGFVNITLDQGFVASSVDAARAGGSAFGRREPNGTAVNVEFVSANPTGPLHVGNARGAFVGDLLCRVLEAAGDRVTREYYFNDFGSQVRNLGASVCAIKAGAEVPEDGYRGGYVHQLALEVPAELWGRATAPGADTAWIVGEWASERIREGIEASLAHLGVRFDVWTSEGSLHRDGWIERAIERLAAGGHIYEAEGATWFRSTAFGDDKDRVIRRSNGAYTYFGADIGYLVEKFGRGFEDLIYIWGVDHHGTVARLRNAADAMGYGRDRVEVLLTAWVRFVRDGEEVSMSKRAGDFITLDDVLAEIGVDAARWSFAAKAANTAIDFDMELAKKQSSENPVYYVQYAHARISAILRRAAETGIAPAASVGTAVIGDPAGMALARALLRLPDVVEDAALARETQGVTAFATELATQFHGYYRDRRVVDASDVETSAARLALVDAARLVLANTLQLLGISAPDVM